MFSLDPALSWLDHLINKTPRPLRGRGGALRRQLVTKKAFHHTPGSSRLYILIPPWHGRLYYDFRIRKKIAAKGFSWVEYEFSPSMLSSDVSKTKVSFEAVRDSILKDIQEWQSRYWFKEMYIVSESMGCVTALMVANRCPAIRKIILVVLGHCLAESLWRGIRTRDIRREMQVSGVTLESLIEQWAELAPENNLEHIHHADFCVYLSHADCVIPYRFGKRLVEVMQRKKLPVTVRENKRWGHYGTVLRFYFSPEID